MSSNEMLVGALLSALGLGVAGHNAIQNKRSNNPRARQGRKVIGSGSNQIAPVNRQDLSIKPPDVRNVPRSVPRNVAALIAWDTVKLDVAITSSTTTIVETNFQFSLQGHPQYASWAALFDQYHIAQASVTFRSWQPPGSTTAPGNLYTALDFDSAGSLGSIPAIEDFSTCAVHLMNEGAVFTRTVKPCCKIPIALSNGSGTNYTADPERVWIDTTSATNIGHYGIRSILGNTGAVYQVIATVTIWYAFKNQV